MKIKITKDINKFFNKLYISFPNLKSIDNSQNLIDNANIKNYEKIKYIYINKEFDKWFVKRHGDNQEIFLFGKIKNNQPQPSLFILTFDELSNYSNYCNGIINKEQVYIKTTYFDSNYPNFKTKLNKTNIDISDSKNTYNIDVIKLGNYTTDINGLLNNLYMLLNELETYKLNNSDNTIDKNNETCDICGKKLKRHEKEICKKCSRKRHASILLIKLMNHIKPQTPFRKNDLNNLFSTNNEINDCIWSLEDFNLINHEKNEYYLVEKDIIDKFIEKYSPSEVKTTKETMKKEEPKKLNKKCLLCKKTLPTSKFYKSNKTKDGFEDYCKICKRYINAANYLKDLTEQINPGTTFKVTDLNNNFENQIEFIGRLWELQDFDLLIYDENEDFYSLKDFKTCQNFLEKYYIKNSATNKSRVKSYTNDNNLTKEEQMNIVIDSILDGKSEKEAAKLAGINLYKITHWFNEGKNNSGKEYIEFYKRYNAAKKQAQINSMKNFYTIESFNNKSDLTLADTLRKQQMENVLKEIGSGSSMKTAAHNSNITFETLQYWYKRGKQNFGEEYNEFYEKINILQSPVDFPSRLQKDIKPTKYETKLNEKDQYKNILKPLPPEYEKIFQTNSGTKESKTGFAWVYKKGNEWRYYKREDGNRIDHRRKSLYDLYDKIKEIGQPWGVRDLEKAKKSLEECQKPDLQTKISSKIKKDDEPNENNENIFNEILNPISKKYSKRFKKTTSTGFAWVRKEKNNWRYLNRNENINISNNNLYNLFLEITKQGHQWGVLDLQKAKKSLSMCEKPKIIMDIPKKIQRINSKITCIYFTQNEIIKAIINGKINDSELISNINNFKEFEDNLIRIITTRHSNFTELFMEFDLKKSDLSKFKKLIDNLNRTTIKENKNNHDSFKDEINFENEYSEEYLLEGKSKTTLKLYSFLKERILSNYENIEMVINKLYIGFKVNNAYIASVAPLTQFLKAWINAEKIQDYKYELRDVTNIGQWGVGNYELKIASEEDVYYFIELFKQSYDEKIK